MNKHLQTHVETRPWYLLYQNQNREKKITEDILDNVKFFISSYQNLSILNKKYFFKLLKPGLEISNYFYFRNNFLPRVVNILKEEITTRLNNCVAISLIPDILEHAREHFLGLGASLINVACEKSFVIRLL